MDNNSVQDSTRQQVLTALAGVYKSIYILDLANDQYTEIVTKSSVHNITGEQGSIADSAPMMILMFVSPSYRDQMQEFADFSTLKDRMKNKSIITSEYESSLNGWSEASFIEYERDEEGNLTKALFVSKIVDMENRALMNYRAGHDSLTSLLSKAAFDDIANDMRVAQYPVALLQLDVDLFRPINDHYGEKVGDRLLIEVAMKLKQAFRVSDTIVRIEGDTFAVLLPNVTSDRAETISEKVKWINTLLQKPEDTNLPKITLSAGIAFSKKGYNDELYKNAMEALRRTKSGTRSFCTIYED